MSRHQVKSLAKQHRPATQQDVGCRKLLRQHMYGRARFLMLARPVRSPLHDVRQHAASGRMTAKRFFMDDAVGDDARRRCRAGLPTGATRGGEDWWSQTGSNRRPPACKAGALPTELQPRGQHGQMAGGQMVGGQMVGQGGFGPPTSRLSSARSNQLSY